ncbi:unnamed protein product [Camellia sinensis]
MVRYCGHIEDKCIKTQVENLVECKLQIENQEMGEAWRHQLAKGKRKVGVGSEVADMVDVISEVAVPTKEAEISAVEAKGDVFVVEIHQVEVQTLVGAEVIHQPDIQNAEQGHSEPITVTLGAVLGHDLGQGDAGLSQSTGKQTPKPGQKNDEPSTAGSTSGRRKKKK